MVFWRVVTTEIESKHRHRAHQFVITDFRSFQLGLLSLSIFNWPTFVSTTSIFTFAALLETRFT